MADYPVSLPPEDDAMRLRATTCHVLPRLLWLGLLLGGCAHQPATVPTAQPPGSTAPMPQERAPVSGPRRYVLDEALNMLGTPYRYGGSSPTGFDCSGLVYYSHLQAGIELPRTARDQRTHSRPVPGRQLQPGDLVFFRLSGRKVDHVGIYAGNGRFVHAPSSGKQVSMASLDNPYWRQRMVGAGNFY